MLIRKKILIVEGVEMTRHYLRHTLTNAGYVIEVAQNAKDALKMANDEDFDLFFVDVHLPELAGIELIKSLRDLDEYKTTPILATTTAKIENLRQKGEAIGVTDWVKKPICPQTVLHMLKAMQLVNVHHVQSLV